LSGRRTCSVCGKGYHINFDKPAQAGICDLCGGSLIQRDDDTELTVVNRLKVYEEQTSSLKVFFKEAGLLHSIDGSGQISEIQQQICLIIEAGGVGDHS
jgi:adenylate kinase